MGLFQKGNKAAAGGKWSRHNPAKEAQSRYIAEMWEKGQLSYKFKNRPLLARIRSAWRVSQRTSRKFYMECARRTGKSSLGLLLLTERAIRFPGTDHLYVAPVKNKLDLYIDPIYRDLFEDCPNDSQPVFKRAKAVIEFPNGSRIILVGSNRETYESAIRSFRLKTIFIDEAREIDDFQDMMDSAALPAVFDSDGYILISSTPGKTLDHILKDVGQTLKLANAYFHNTIHDVGYPPERISEFEKETCKRNCTGSQKHSPAWLREYLAEWVRDESVLIIPEFDIRRHVMTPAKDALLYPFYFKFEAMDQGGVHKTVVLFAYFRWGKTPSLVIDGEEVFTGTDVRVDIMAKRIREREAKCKFDKVFRRTADVNDRIAVSSLNSMYGFDFTPVVKMYGQNVSGDKGLKAMVGEARTWFVGDPAVIAINPACTELIGALQNCVWTDHGTFATSKNYGHADVIAALVYLVRNIPSQCPFPAGYQYNAYSTFDEKQLLGAAVDKELQALQDAFGPSLEGLNQRPY